MKRVRKDFQCHECGKLLTLAQAERAAERGCPKCGGVDIDIAENEDTNYLASVLGTTRGAEESSLYALLLTGTQR